MQCCAPFCRNALDIVSTTAGKSKEKGVTFHTFPQEVHLRSAWLRALGQQNTRLPDCAVVCSQHFLSDDFYETDSGLRQIVTGAIPSAVQVCMICLDTDSKLLLVRKYNLEEPLEKLTGYPLFQLCQEGNLKHTVCVLCARRLINFSQFREISLRSRSLMMNLVENQDLITVQHIKNVSRTKHKLKWNFGTKTLGPDHCDFYITENSNEDPKVDLEEQRLPNVVVKVEAVSSDGDVIDESHVSHDKSKPDTTIKLETQPMDNTLYKALHTEPASCSSAFAGHEDVYTCELCFEKFTREHEYNNHMSRHLQNVDLAGGCETPPGYEPRAAASSSCGHAYAPGHMHAVQGDDSSAAESAQASAAAFVNKLRPTENSDKINESIQVITTHDDDLNNKPYSTNNTKKIIKKCGGYDVFKVLKKIQKPFNPCDNQDVNTTSQEPHCKLASEVTATENKQNITKTWQTEIDCSNNDNVQCNNSPEHSLNKQCTEKKIYTCDLCGNMFKRKNCVVIHMKTHNKVAKPFTCKFCNYKCSRIGLLVIHTRTHTGEKPFSCEICNYRCARKGDLKKHKKVHTGEKPYSCELCNYKCKQNGSLVSHMKIHTGEKPFSCNLCNYKCARSGELVRHMRTHTGETPYSCKLCNYKCSQSGKLLVHMILHTGEKPYSCELCNYKCTQKKQLKSHTKSHTGEKPYSCTLCSYRFAKNGNLQSHMKIHIGEKAYSCTQCNYKCARKNELVIHTRIHTGEHPYSCEMCNYKCKKKYSLVSHMKIHTGEKPYSCEICNYKSARSGQLVTHMRIHTGEKPYSCEICNYKCAVKHRLVVHMRTHNRMV